ncbi:MAG: two-component regulator propeller domain-containing protein [Chryseolinea sp.]
MKHINLYSLLCVVSLHFCNAQYIPEAIKNSISETKANAPQRIVRNIIQDRKGNLWIASHEGVFRYDGKTFTNITLEVAPPRVDSGPENRFYAVIEDKDGNFWFASTDSGVYFYDGKSIRNFTTANGLPSNRVHEIYQDTSGNIWFGSMGGASRYDGKSFQTFTTEQGLPNNNVSEIHPG